jgi:hypothetical protein
VVRPGGTLGLLWNVIDDSVACCRAGVVIVMEPEERERHLSRVRSQAPPGSFAIPWMTDAWVTQVL